jgi:hypothetical protein
MFDTPPLAWESTFLSLGASEHGIASMRFYASLIRDPLSSEEAPMDSKSLKNVALTHSSNSEVVFEDYLFYATLQREEYGGTKINSETTEVTEKPQELPPLSPDEQERMEATRALRITSWISVFFLLTTDMAGSIFVPYAISQVGWVPGAILFTLRCVCSLLVASLLIHRPISSGHTIDILRDSTMVTVPSTRFSQVSTQDVWRCRRTDFREICAIYLQFSAINTITYHRIYSHRDEQYNS